jgi:flagellar biosynthesis protein FlhB
MAQQGDSESKTEEPTEKKIHDEFERGNIPISKEASLLATSATTLIILAFLARDALRSIAFTLAQMSNDPADWLLLTSDAVALFITLAREIARPLIPVVVILVVAGLASTFLQHAPRFAPARLRPDFARISIINGWRRIFGANGRTEFLKSVGKLISIAIVLSMVLRSQGNALIGAMSLDPDAIPEVVLMIATRLLTAVCAITVVLLALDLVSVRSLWRKGARMTKQEVKDELKEA